jgi:hypothetical protein
VVKTSKDKKEAELLQQQFRDGPVIDRITKEKRIDKNGQPIKPFTKLLDAEIVRLQEEIEREIESLVRTRRDGQFLPSNDLTAR